MEAKMIKTFLAILTLIYFLTGNAFSQVLEEWVARYNGLGNGSDTPRTIAMDDSGNVYVSGESFGIGSDFDYAVVKYNSEGIQQWVATYNGPANNEDRPYAMTIDDSGNVYLTGTSSGSGTRYDYATVKYNRKGIEQWVARYNGPDDELDRANATAVDGSGNVYVTGQSFREGTELDYVTVKYDTSGTQAWVARYNGPGNLDDVSNSIVVDDFGNIYVSGFTTGSDGYCDFATIKYDSSGKQQWVEYYNGPGNRNDKISSMAIDDSSNIYVTGESFGDTTGQDWATIKYDSAGIEQWIVRYNGTLNSSDSPNKIIVDEFFNVYVAGYGTYDRGDDEDFTTIKYNSSGKEQWVSTYNGPYNGRDVVYSMAVDGLGNVYVTGWSWVVQLDYDFATVKYNSSGEEQWVAIYNGPGDGNDWSFCIATDVSGNAYVAGWSEGDTTYYDFATIKYSSTTGVKHLSNNLPVNYILSQNYPNPFNPVTTIEFQIPKTGLVFLKIYDILGQEIATLIDQPLPAGQHQVQWDASNVSSGVYFYRLKVGDHQAIRKMLLVR
jgi:uncharacterized delta-60 repeat protein